MNQKLNKRKCKVCEQVFQKFSPLQMFCSQSCERTYKNKKQREKLSIKAIKKEAGEPKEYDIFKDIWESLKPIERKSFITGKVLRDNINARAWYFSHVLPKGKNKYPMFKYYKKNIVLKEFEEHELWEHHQYKLKDLPSWNHVFELKEELIQEYSEHLKLFEQGYVEYYKIQ
jgi:hypothetical protein